MGTSVDREHCSRIFNKTRLSPFDDLCLIIRQHFKTSWLASFSNGTALVRKCKELFCSTWLRGMGGVGISSLGIINQCLYFEMCFLVIS